MVNIALYSLAEALSDLQLRHQNSLFSANVVLFRGPKQASSSEADGGLDPVRERVKPEQAGLSVMPVHAGLPGCQVR